MNTVREDTVVGVGMLAKHKNAKLVVEAVALMPEPRPRVLWITAAIDETYATVVRNLADAGGVDFEVRHNADDESLVSLLNRACVLVYASRLEPFGLVPLEASACELPVVAIHEGGLREIVEHEMNGLVVRPTASELAGAIRRIRTDPELATRLGRTGRALVSARWTTDQAAARLEGWLSSLVMSDDGPSTGTYSSDPANRRPLP